MTFDPLTETRHSRMDVRTTAEMADELSTLAATMFGLLRSPENDETPWDAVPGVPESLVHAEQVSTYAESPEPAEEHLADELAAATAAVEAAEADDYDWDGAHAALSEAFDESAIAEPGFDQPPVETWALDAAVAEIDVSALEIPSLAAAAPLSVTSLAHHQVQPDHQDDEDSPTGLMEVPQLDTDFLGLPRLATALAFDLDVDPEPEPELEPVVEAEIEAEIALVMAEDVRWTQAEDTSVNDARARAMLSEIAFLDE